MLVVKNPPANAADIQTWVQSLDQEDPLEKVMATHSSILAWKIPWTEEPGGLQSMRPQRVGYDWSRLALMLYSGYCSPRGSPYICIYTLRRGWGLMKQHFKCFVFLCCCLVFVFSKEEDLPFQVNLTLFCLQRSWSPWCRCLPLGREVTWVM